MCAGQDLHARRRDVGLADAQGLAGPAARAEGGHHVALAVHLARPALRVAVTLGVRREEGEQRRAVGELDVDGRQEVVVGLQVGDGGGLVVEDHAGRAALHGR